jgi:hypothetical protein
MGMGRDGTPGSAGLHLAADVPLLHPGEQVFAAMLEGWRAQQLARNLALATAVLSVTTMSVETSRLCQWRRHEMSVAPRSSAPAGPSAPVLRLVRRNHLLSLRR